MEIKKFDIVQVNFGTVIDSEQGGIRPAVILQNDVGNHYSSTTIVIPLSSKMKSIHQPTHAVIKKSETNGLKMDSLLLAEQIRAISKNRIIKKIGTVRDETSKSEIRRVCLANFAE